MSIRYPKVLRVNDILNEVQEEAIAFAIEWLKGKLSVS